MSIEVWYVGRFSIAPEKTTFARETASFYIGGNGRRTKKESRWYRYFTSEQDAKAAIHARAEMKNQTTAKRRLEDAAPDLLAALEAVLAYVIDDEQAQTSPTVSMARAAIDKATGGDA